MYLVIVHHIWTTIVAVGHLSNKLRLKGKPLSLYSKRCTRLRPIHHSSVMSIATFDRVAVAILDVSPVVITMLGGIDDGFRRCLAELLPPGFARDVTRWRYPLTSLHELSPRHTKKNGKARPDPHYPTPSPTPSPKTMQTTIPIWHARQAQRQTKPIEATHSRQSTVTRDTASSDHNIWLDADLTSGSLTLV